MKECEVEIKFNDLKEIKTIVETESKLVIS
jgi:hypothetical protein